jgi:hypothetical protein
MRPEASVTPWIDHENSAVRGAGRPSLLRAGRYRPRRDAHAFREASDEAILFGPPGVHAD